MDVPNGSAQFTGKMLEKINFQFRQNDRAEPSSLTEQFLGQHNGTERRVSGFQSYTDNGLTRCITHFTLYVNTLQQTCRRSKFPFAWWEFY